MSVHRGAWKGTSLRKAQTAALPLALASLGFLFVGFRLARLHSDVLFGQHPAAMPEHTRHQLIVLLDAVDLNVRALVLLGIAFAAWSFRGRPTWVACVALLAAWVVGLSLLIGIT